MNWAIAILALVTLQRLAELALAASNTRRLLAAGGKEHGSGHYPLIIAVHLAWLATLWWLSPGRDIQLAWLALFGLLQLARAWVIITLGRRWTTRIIVVPGEPPMTSGPYRWLNHPNYWVVAGEIAVLPLAFGLPWVALAFTLLNALVMQVRIASEDRALGRLRR